MKRLSGLFYIIQRAKQTLLVVCASSSAHWPALYERREVARLRCLRQHRVLHRVEARLHAEQLRGDRLAHRLQRAELFLRVRERRANRADLGAVVVRPALSASTLVSDGTSRSAVRSERISVLCCSRLVSSDCRCVRMLSVPMPADEAICVRSERSSLAWSSSPASRRCNFMRPPGCVRRTRDRF